MYKVPSSMGDGRALEPAWSPLSWLRIVYGVWFDQRWYWRVVRPRLGGKLVGWPLLAQAVAGSVLCSLGLLLLPLAVWSTLDIQVERPNLFFAVVMVYGLALLITAIGIRIRGMSYAIVSCVALMVVCGLLFSLMASMGMIVYARVPPPPDPFLARPISRGLDLDDFLIALPSMALGLMLGLQPIEGGVFEWRKGRSVHFTPAVRLGLFVLWVGIVLLLGVSTVLGDYTYRHLSSNRTWSLLQTFLRFGGMFVGIFFGASLVTRQVPDPEERRRLARPDEGLGARVQERDEGK